MSRVKVAVAMSGGVDSSVAAALLLEEGFDVVGVTMRLWRGEGSSESSAETSAMSTAARLGIQHVLIDLEEQFSQCVVDDFVREYARGRTPNPCVRCNAEIKFGALLDYARRELGVDKLATGHYARIERDDGTERWKLMRGVDRSKDQSYFLYRLTQAQLGSVLFPLGTWTKQQTRKAAEERGIEARMRPESQDVCFLPDEHYGEFLSRRSPELVRPGPIVDTSGRQLGTHRGIAFYTIGQRRGLGVAASERLYVVAIDADDNTVVLGVADELAKHDVIIDGLSAISGDKLTESIVVTAKIRYNAQDSKATLRPLGSGRAELAFEKAQNAVTPGQSAVFYAEDEVLGGGTIVGIAPTE